MRAGSAARSRKLLRLTQDLLEIKMGPKAKKSKEEIAAEKAAKEEEERLAAEAEKKRLEELAEQQRLEAIRIAEERAAERKVEIDRLMLEHMSYLDYFQENDMKRAFDEANEAAAMEWDKICHPVDTPDATRAKDMNTFITLAQQVNLTEMSDVLDTITYMVKVASSVERVWGDAIAKGDNEAVINTTDYIERINAVILKNLDQGTAHFMRFVDKHLNDKFEVNVEECAGNVMMGFWGSMSDMRPIRKSVQFDAMGIQMDIPKQILQQEIKFVHRVIKIPLDPKSMATYIKKADPGAKVEATGPPTESAVELSEEEAAAIIKSNSKQVLADLYYIDIIVPPAQAYEIRAKRWVIRDKSDKATNLHKIPSYPSTIGTRCFIKVPDHIIISDDVRVNIWNQEKGEWCEDHISDYQYSESSRLCQFMMTTVGVIALVKNRLSAFPFKKWQFKPVREVKGKSRSGAAESKSADGSSARGALEQRAQFTITTQTHTIVINIEGNSVSLATAEGIDPAIEDMVGVEMNPGMLLTKLQKHGCNLLASDNDLADCEKMCGHMKNVDLENDVYLQMSQCASALEFCSSTWNKELSPSQVGLLARESTVYNAVDESFDYECIRVEMDEASQTYKWTPDLGVIKGTGAANAKFTNVVGNQYGSRPGFDNSIRPGERSHIELVEAMKNRITPETYKRARRTHGTFAQTIYTMLSLVKPLSLTKQE